MNIKNIKFKPGDTVERITCSNNGMNSRLGRMNPGDRDIIVNISISGGIELKNYGAGHDPGFFILTDEWDR